MINNEYLARTLGDCTRSTGYHVANVWIRQGDAKVMQPLWSTENYDNVTTEEAGLIETYVMSKISVATNVKVIEPMWKTRRHENGIILPAQKNKTY